MLLKPIEDNYWPREVIVARHFTYLDIKMFLNGSGYNLFTE